MKKDTNKKDVKTKLSLIYKFLIIIISGIGLYLNFSIMNFDDAILYFTIQSNLLCFIFYVAAFILYLTKKLKKNDTYYLLKGMVTMAITVTMVVYQVIALTDGHPEVYKTHMLACNFVHLFTPLLIIFDYIIFGEKGNLKENYPFIWSIVLIAYLLFDMVYVAAGGTFITGEKYPYFYMDPNTYGMTGVIVNCVIIYILFVGYGFIVQTLDNKIGKKKRIKN